jgi:hypothetical protein
MYRPHQGLLITMTPFTSLTSVAAPLPEGDVDTDIIFPARFLLLLNKDGLAEQLFHERRRSKGQPKFVLDTPPFDRATILVVGENFGCGTSREQRPGRSPTSASASSWRRASAEIFNNRRKRRLANRDG